MYLEPRVEDDQLGPSVGMRRSPTLMTDLEDRPKHLVPFLALVRSVFRVFHLVAELEKRILDILKAIRRWLAVASRSNGRHDCFALYFRMVSNFPRLVYQTYVCDFALDNNRGKKAIDGARA